MVRLPEGQHQTHFCPKPKLYHDFLFKTIIHSIKKCGVHKQKMSHQLQICIKTLWCPEYYYCLLQFASFLALSNTIKVLFLFLIKKKKNHILGLLSIEYKLTYFLGLCECKLTIWLLLLSFTNIPSELVWKKQLN